ncbi:hypothetical protein DXG03_006993 [Asterophora parasitica]|uniref:Uncharacterized protein n=1 Tax=Asterophora parasitica TaxID=117018 RepID=A0A9P7GE90_9AGAR|nr:hypothetical protein DXG03_006993 [Asterophora parasitica]
MDSKGAKDAVKSFPEPSPHAVVDFSVPEGRPPSFAPYEAEFFRSSDGDIISHDHHLNEDGDHLETRTRQVARTVNDRTEYHTETYTVTVQDFNFSIDLTGLVARGPVHWSFADSEPAYRGLMVRQVQAPEGRRKATKEETESFKAWEYQRAEKGYPPWASRDGNQNLDVLQSSQTLRQWADEYCSSPKHLKEFVYEKFVHNWNIQGLAEAIRGAILQTHYQGRISVDFNLSATKIFIRPDNRLSRTLSKTWVKVLLCIFLIYPFIWLFKRYHSRGGGRWEVCGGAYALKYTEPVDAASWKSDRNDVVPSAPPRIVETELGPQKLYGEREGEWFRRWEAVVKRSVALRVQRSVPMRDVREGPADALDGYMHGNSLDGYN